MTKEEKEYKISEWSRHVLMARQRWSRGEWDKEVDRYEFEAYGFSCLLNRGLMGHWCGYVAIPKTHPLFGKYEDELNKILDAPGGVTFADPPFAHICLLNKKDDDLWFIGYDCAHSRDLIPALDKTMGPFLNKALSARPDLNNEFLRPAYRTLEFNIQETTELAHQLFEKMI